MPPSKMNIKSPSKRLTFAFAAMLSSIMLAAPSMLPINPTQAFALEIGEEFREKQATVNNEGDGTAVGPVVQVLPQINANVDVDDDIVVDLCQDGSVEAVDNQEDVQANRQSGTQSVDTNNRADQFGTVVSPAIQAGVQLGVNIKADKDVILGLNCHGQDIQVPDDDSVQENNQELDQEGGSENEAAGPGNLALNVLQQYSIDQSINRIEDTDVNIIQ
jgi:hypothetical protein